jgi:rubrerythrin
MSSVVKNLREAVIGEKNAQIKYKLFAQKAAKEGFNEISKLFNAISGAEAIHIKNHLKAIEKITNDSVDLASINNIERQNLEKTVKSTRENLIEAISGESFEFKKMYKAFIKTARRNNIFLAEFSFDLARRAEKVHKKLLENFLEKLENNEKYTGDDIFVCQICGNVELGVPPKVCSICGHEKMFFKKFTNQ